jgi:hypothetical protein
MPSPEGNRGWGSPKASMEKGLRRVPTRGVASSAGRVAVVKRTEGA